MIEERRDLILGLQLHEDYAQLTYYNSGMKEPATLCEDEEKESYLIPLERGEELSSVFSRCLERVSFLGSAEDVRIMVTVPKLEPPLDEEIPKALEGLGVLRKYIFLQDYSSSFYHYTINQKKELWMSDVALLEYEEGIVNGYVLHVDRNTKPALVKVEKAASQKMDETVRDGRSEEEWNREKDRLFFELLKKVFERRTVTTSYLLGDFFDKSWAERSFQYLCYHRHAFQGSNLYSRGACYGAMERMGIVTHPDLLFMGADIVHENMGMYLRAWGKEMYYPIVTAGVNWYEAHHVCEFVPDKEKSITLITKPMTGGQEVNHILRLKDFPKRPNRATRLRMTVYFVSARRCRVEVEDLGFGGFYRSSGKKWSREIIFG